jgi:hypothetical protein
MATTVNLATRYELYIPRKATTKIAQPDYGTDMRAIENGVNLLVQGVVSTVAELQAQIDTNAGNITTIQGQITTIDGQITTINNDLAIRATDNIGYMVGGPPPSGTVLHDDMSVVSVAFTAGVGTTPVTGYSHGYWAQVGGADNTGTIVAVIPGSSTLSTLGVFATAPGGTAYTGTASLTVRIVGA